MIKTVIRIENDMVMVFDENGKQIPEYQGSYAYVKDKIMADAAEDTVFNHWFGQSLKPHKIAATAGNGPPVIFYFFYPDISENLLDNSHLWVLFYY